MFRVKKSHNGSSHDLLLQQAQAAQQQQQLHHLQHHPAFFAAAAAVQQQQAPSPQQAFVSMAFDYEYVDEGGKKVFMREGEVLLLLNKTNHDWWQVRERK